MTLQEPAPLFGKISQETLDLLRELNVQQQVTFLIPTRFISTENAQLAYLLHTHYNANRTQLEQKIYRSFFVNSRYEALQGAIKLITHYGVTQQTKRVVILDPQMEVNYLVNPLDQANEADFLIPNIKLVSTFEALFRHIHTANTIAGVILRNTKTGLPVSECSKIVELCKRRNIVMLWDDPDWQPGKEFLLHQLTSLPDMVILGESLTGYDIPFALFSMSKEVHAAWATPETCMIHTSTYAGNKLAVTKARDTMLKEIALFRNNQETKDILDQMQNEFQKTLYYYAHFINPALPLVYSFLGYNFICKKGHGSWIDIYDGRKEKHVLDVVGGGGTTTWGNTPDDLVPEVIMKHDGATDYWGKLQQKFKSLLGFEHAFPAISGATAVENAMILSLLANRDKKRVIVFKGNYAGKTLVSLIGTADTLSKMNSSIYRHVLYIDPFHANAEMELIQELEKGDVALVWFEIIQGNTITQLPEKLLEAVRNYQTKAGYYIGIDEILMGFYRVDKLTSYQDTSLKPDVITFSKALSGGIFPMGATLVSAEIYNKANQSNPKLVAFLQQLYLNQFGAHIGLHSVEKLTSPAMVEQIQRTSQLIEKGMEEVAQSSPFLEKISGKGHIYCLHYKNKSLLYTFYFTKKALEQENLFMFFERLEPTIGISEEDARELIRRLKKLFSGNRFITELAFRYKLIQHLAFLIIDGLVQLATSKKGRKPF